MGFGPTTPSQMSETHYPPVDRPTDIIETSYIIGFIESSATLILWLVEYISIPAKSFRTSAECVRLLSSPLGLLSSALGFLLSPLRLLQSALGFLSSLLGILSSALEFLSSPLGLLPSALRLLPSPLGLLLSLLGLPGMAA